MLGGKNKQHRQPLGYTIVEVMIVLAVSGFMFVIAANFINGKQASAAFTQGSNDMGSKLQGIIEDVVDGHYSDVPLGCTISAGAPANLSAQAGSGSQGTSSDCVFQGKMVSFYPAGGGSGTSHYYVYSVAGARDIAKYPNVMSGVRGLTAPAAIPQSLYVAKMTVTAADDTTANAYNIGFLQDSGQADAATGAYVPGPQKAARLVYSTSTLDSPDDATRITGGVIKDIKSASICLSDGARYAQILLGAADGGDFAKSNDNPLNVSVQQLGKVSCAS